MTVNDVFQWLDSFAPFDTQDEYDNAGLLAGDPKAEVFKILFALDVTRPVVAEAVRFGAELIVAHHPLMFRPVRQLRYDQGEGAVLKALIKSGVSLIAAHTNLDRCAGGVADSLAQALALSQVTPCEGSPYLRKGTLKAPCAAKELLIMINRRLSARTRMYGDADTVIQSVAVTPGAGGEDYVHALSDAFVTGEIKHHELLDAMDRGLIVFDAGHYPTEFPGVSALYKRFLKAASKSDWQVEAKLYTQPPYPCASHG
ncbi:MAG: Nif3-like dinuclear metal center hexameric protein [Bacillota bacterium]